MTHRDGFPRLSARSAWRGDAGHWKPCTPFESYGPSESLGKPAFRSRHRYVKAKVGVHEYPDATLAIFHDPRCLGPATSGARDLSARRYVYFSPRLDQDKQCIPVIIGADEIGRKELLAITDGYRETAQSWREVLPDFKRRGLLIAPELATGDGALGFRKTLREVYGAGRPVDMMDKPDGLPTSPQAQQPQQDVVNRILAA